MNQTYILWLLASLFYAYQLILRTLPVITENELREIFNLSNNSFGQFRGIYYIAYTIVHLPMAYIFDKYGVRKTFPICIFLAVIGISPMIWSTSSTVLILGRVILGIGSSAAILGLFKVIRISFDDNHFSRMLGMAATIGLLSMILGFGPLKTFFNYYGYHFSLITLSIIGIILALSIFIAAPKKEKFITPQSFLVEVKELLTNRNFLFITIAGGLMIGTFEGFTDGWAVPYLINFYNVNLETATYGASMISFGFAVGSSLLSTISDLTKRHIQVVALSGLFMSLCFLALFFFKLPCSMAFFIYFILGVFCGYQVLVIYLAGKSVPKQLVTLSGAGANMVIMSFGYLFHTISAYLMEGTQIINNGAYFYQTTSLIKGLAIIPALSFVGWALLTFGKKFFQK